MEYVIRHMPVIKPYIWIYWIFLLGGYLFYPPGREEILLFLMDLVPWDEWRYTFIALNVGDFARYLFWTFFSKIVVICESNFARSFINDTSRGSKT